MYFKMDFSELFLFCLLGIILKNNVNCLAPPYYGIDRPKLEYELPPLEFGFGELEPYMDEETVRVHYLGHHAKYTENMNKALKEWRASDKLASRRSIIDVLRNLSSVPEKWRTVIKNNGGGYVNHNFFWSVMSQNSDTRDRIPEGKLADDIDQIWGSFNAFRQAFTDQAINLFGSGYVWLCRTPINEKASNRPTINSDLIITTSINQDSPVSDGLHPILVIDVWEHAYYLKHQNIRANYVNNWWKLVDWTNVNHLDKWWKGAQFHDEL